MNNRELADTFTLIANLLEIKGEVVYVTLAYRKAAESLLSTGSGWVLQFNIVNHEGHDTTYSVGVQNGNQTGGDSFVVKDGGTYTYIYNILQQKAGGQLDVSVFKEGDSQPFEHSTYYLK